MEVFTLLLFFFLIFFFKENTYVAYSLIRTSSYENNVYVWMLCIILWMIPNKYGHTQTHINKCNKYGIYANTYIYVYLYMEWVVIRRNGLFYSVPNTVVFCMAFLSFTTVISMDGYDVTWDYASFFMYPCLHMLFGSGGLCGCWLFCLICFCELNLNCVSLRL